MDAPSRSWGTPPSDGRTRGEPVNPDRVVLWGTRAFVVIFGFLPIVNCISGNLEASWYPALVLGWGRDAVLVLGAGVVLAMVTRRFSGAWPSNWTAHPVRSSAKA